MKSHLERLKEQENETKRQKRKNKRMGRMLIAVTLLGLSVFSLFTLTTTIDPKNSAQAKEPDTEAMDKDSWELILVNSQNVLSRDFTVDLIRIGNIRVDCRIAEPLQKMIDAAKDEGIILIGCSGFRSVPEQDALFNEKCLAYLADGYSDEASNILTSQYLQKGGASEHHTGLAVDFLTTGVSELSERFSESPAYTWLENNAAKYGFIERYPKGKSEITGILWEPWHYRYVGNNNAEALSSKDLCLEEYLLDVSREP